MSYADYQIERELVASDIGPAALVVTPGYSPIVLRAVAIVITTTTSVAANVFTINHRDPAGGAATVVDTVTVPSGTTAGSVIYLDGLDQLVKPGEDIQIVGDDGATGAGVITAFFEPAWDTPANNTNMTESA